MDWGFRPSLKYYAQLLPVPSLWWWTLLLLLLLLLLFPLLWDFPEPPLNLVDPEIILPIPWLLLLPLLITPPSLPPCSMLATLPKEITLKPACTLYSKLKRNDLLLTLVTKLRNTCGRYGTSLAIYFTEIVFKCSYVSAHKRLFSCQRLSFIWRLGNVYIGRFCHSIHIFCLSRSS